MTTYVSCPFCQVKYPLRQLYQHSHDKPSAERKYTVVCSVCSKQFEVEFRKRWRGLLPLQPVMTKGPNPVEEESFIKSSRIVAR